MSVSSSMASLADLIDSVGDLRPHLSIAHHIPGRVRLKIGIGALGVLKAGAAGGPSLQLEDLCRIQGIQSVRLNAGAQSVVVSYDPAVIPPSFWQDCLSLPEDRLRAMLAATLPPGKASLEEDAPRSDPRGLS
ncbi:heavy-metal-associated domain-containing protein [Pararhodospirillum oryzae]|uniref:Cation transporter n=1 Tax=Pararhodospirillum oryzae TaxID=478448 RepID=A0A512H354_9PROT|nr:heavy-metal-associated domain-containing protein [Pararhodospirillum oryzae]GEO79896.1 hypothetical protein ROR02_00270 [Pararhodospirillum oryzae]